VDSKKVRIAVSLHIGFGFGSSIEVVKVKGHECLNNRRTAVFTYGKYCVTLRYISYCGHAGTVLHLFLYLLK
jgi:hypothetical protein